VLFLVLFGGNLPTPFYPLWQQQFGLSTGTITGVYAIYPAGVVLGLLFGGRLADQLGRRPILALAALASILGEACFIMAGSVALLFAGRLINGCAIGLLSGPAVAAITELKWMGSSEIVGRLAPPEQRASVTSAFYIVAYAGVALPVLAVGVSADWVGLPAAVATLAVAVTVVALSLVARFRVRDSKE
jgi:MFS family permease